MENWQERTALLLGEAALAKLAAARVLVVGCGGVGACVAEMLARAGVGAMTIVDGDKFHVSNLNRQLPALVSTLGQSKVAVLKRRLEAINPAIEVEALEEFLRDERTAEVLENGKFDFLVDAIDTLSPKVFLLFHAHRLGVPTISSMGSGGKLDPLQVKVADISKTEYCHLARMVRKRLGKLGVRSGITAVFSSEEVSASAVKTGSSEANKNSTIGTISYMPAVFGCVIASEVIKKLVEK